MRAVRHDRRTGVRGSIQREGTAYRFEVNNDYRARLADAGFIASGISPEVDLVEIMELQDHPFFVGAVPLEFRSRPNRPHPIFREFVLAAIEHLPEGAQRSLPLNGPPGPTTPPSQRSLPPTAKPTNTKRPGRRPKGNELKAQIEKGAYPGIVKTTLDDANQIDYITGQI